MCIGEGKFCWCFQNARGFYGIRLLCQEVSKHEGIPSFQDECFYFLAKKVLPLGGSLVMGAVVT